MTIEAMIVKVKFRDDEFYLLEESHRYCSQVGRKLGNTTFEVSRPLTADVIGQGECGDEDAEECREYYEVHEGESIERSQKNAFDHIRNQRTVRLSINQPYHSS